MKTSADKSSRNEIHYKEIDCAVCKNGASYRVLYPERINASKINFSARHVPDKMHHRIVKCKECGLHYFTPIFSDEYIMQLYRENKYTDEPQVLNYLQDYTAQLGKVTPYLERKDNLLEIGCGNGFFLKAALEAGFKNVIGVEPCKDAVEKADPEIKDKIILDFFKEELFEDEIFDIICSFQVFDHIIDPNKFLRYVYKILKPGGLVLIISHDIRSLMNRILGENSPMITMGHICLFDKTTMRKILENNNFKVLYIRSLLSLYNLGYSLRMFPFPEFFKRFILKAAESLKITNLQTRFPAGNLVAVAKKI